MHFSTKTEKGGLAASVIPHSLDRSHSVRPSTCHPQIWNDSHSVRSASPGGKSLLQQSQRSKVCQYKNGANWCKKQGDGICHP